MKSKPDLSVSTEVPVKGEEATKTKKKTKTKASKKVKKTKGRPDEDLFGNTDDIFGDLPVEISKSPKTKRTKKKVTEDPKTEEGSSKAGGEHVCRPRVVTMHAFASCSVCVNPFPVCVGMHSWDTAAVEVAWIYSTL